VQKMAKLFGPVVARLSEVSTLHLKYKEKLLTYFLEICHHSDDVVRKWAVHNLPCMHLLFKKVENCVEGLNFQDLYLRFSDDEDGSLRVLAAASLHEAFKILDDDEDISKLH